MHGSIAIRPVEQEESSGRAASFGLPEVLDFLARRWKLMLAAAGCMVALAFFILLTITPRYSATTQILIDAKPENMLGQGSMMSELALDSTAIDSQVTILQSRSLLQRVVKARNLVKDPEFGSVEAEAGVFQRLVDLARNSVSGEPAPESLPAPAPAVSNEAMPPEVLRAVNRLRNALEVRREARTLVVNVTVTSIDRAKAASLADAIADAYIIDKLEARFDRARRAATWLSDRIEVLGADLRTSEQAVAEFRVRHNLVETRTGTLSEQQLSDLNAKLVGMRAETAEKRAKYEQSRSITAVSGNLDAIPDVLRSPVITSLRNQAGDVTRREADLLARYGRNHPQVINIQAERRDMERQIQAEIQRVIANLKNDLDVTISREESLAASLGRAGGQTGADNKVAVELRQLERAAAANKVLYESFLSRSKIAEEETTLANREARIISNAALPIAPSYPNKLFVLGFAFAIGLALGTAGGFALDILNRGFMSPRQVEEALDLPVLASLPLIEPRELSHEGKTLTIPEYLLLKPLSQFSEAVRSVRTSIQMSDVDDPPQLVQVTSAMPNEGKTTTAICLGISAAAAGQKVLLIDGDLRHPSLSRFFRKEKAEGLVDCLLGTLDEVPIFVDERAGIHVLPAGARTQHPPDLLGSARMKALIAELRERYDYIVIDTPPLTPVIDGSVVAAIADKVVFAVRWNETPRELVADALESIRTPRKVAGVVLTMLNEKAMPQYGRYAYYGKAYYNKYYAG